MDKLLTLTEAAEALRTPIETLRYWRAIGTGPQGVKVGRRVLYREADVVAWFDAQSDAQRATAAPRAR